MKEKQSAIPKATAKRLSLYYRIFKRFNAEKIERANSKQIAEAIGIDSALFVVTSLTLANLDVVDLAMMSKSS